MILILFLTEDISKACVQADLLMFGLNCFVLHKL